VSQQDYRSFTGPSGPGRASRPGVLRVFCPVDDRCSVVEVGSSCPAVELLSPIRRCRVSSLYRSCVIVLDETVKVTARSWWCVPVGVKFGGGAPVCLSFFVGGGREKSLSARLTLTRCRFRVAPFLPGGRRGKPLFTSFRVGGNPRTI
jgi:hypothetical protein